MRALLNRAGMGATDHLHHGEIAVIPDVQAPVRSLAGGVERRYKRRNPKFPVNLRTKLMATERTFSIIKPDATARNLTGAVNALIEKAGLRIVAQKRIRMTREQAETFYAVHKARPFFGELVDFMI